MLQIVLSVNIPISFIILVMTSTAWHNFELFKKDSLTLLRQVVIMPFFLPSIFMKMGILSTTVFYVGSITYNYTKSVPLTSSAVIAIVLVLLAYQISLHFFLGFQFKDDSVVLSIFGNLTSNARPAEDEDLVKSFFKVETLLSTFLYTLMTTCTTTYIVLYDYKKLYLAYIGFAFIVLHLLSTQLYLRTSTGHKLLFPKAEETNPSPNPKADSSVTTARDSKGERKTKLAVALTWAKWIILTISIAATVGLFCYVGIVLTRGKNNLQ